MGVTLYVSAPPASQYQRGATLAIEAETPAVAAALLDEYLLEDGVGETLIRDIVGSNLARAVLAKDTGPAASGGDTVTPVEAGSTEPLATKGQIAAAAKKSGKDISELQGITVEEAKALLKGAK